MDDINKIIKEIKKQLEKEDLLHHQAVSVAYEVYLLEVEYGFSDREKINELKEKVLNKFKAWQVDEPLTKVMNYAIRIASHESQILYEEMHKLFSLCNEIKALEYFGFTAENDLEEKFKSAIKSCFAKESKMAKLVAEDKLDDWSKEFWWFKLALNY